MNTLLSSKLAFKKTFSSLLSFKYIHKLIEVHEVQKKKLYMMFNVHKSIKSEEDGKKEKKSQKQQVKLEKVYRRKHRCAAVH